MVITVSDKSSDEAMSKILFEEYPVRTKKNNLQEKSGKKVNNKTTKQQKQQQQQINIATYKLVDDDVPTFSLALKKAIVNHYWANFSHLLLLISTNYV